MFENGFPPYWSTLKKLIWLVGAGIAGRVREVWKTVTGTLIHITDALASPMQKCEVTLEPIQDLNGQDAPYPAGGGKNKWGNGNLTINAYQLITLNYELPAGEYTLSGVIHSTDTDTSVCTFSFRDGNNSVIGTLGIFRSTGSERVSQSITLTGIAESVYIYAAQSAGASTGDTATFDDMQIESGSSATYYSPYSNICPITGWTGANVTRTGVNVWDEDWELGTINTTTGADEATTSRIRSSYIPVKPNTTYYYYVGVSMGNGRSAWYDANKNFISGNSNTPYAIIIAPANAYYLRVSPPSGYGTTYNNDISINYPSADHDYHAYSGTTLSVTFPNTVYGGKYNFVDGKGDSNLAEVDLGTLGWVKAEQGGQVLFYAPLSNGTRKDTGECLCSIYPTANNAVEFQDNDKICRQYGSTVWDFSRVAIKDSSFDGSTVEVFTSAMSGVQLVYELATPTEIQLTPQEISTLAGENNVWSNTNGDTTLIYKAQA